MSSPNPHSLLVSAWIFCLLQVFNGCNTTEPSPKYDIRLLSGKDWLLVSETVSPGYTESDGHVIRNPIDEGRIESCLLDNTYRYDSAGTWTENGGAAKCFSSEQPIVASGTWGSNSTRTLFYLSTTYSDSGVSNDTTYYVEPKNVIDTLHIQELSVDTLKLFSVELDRDSVGYKYLDTVTSVFIAQ